MCGFCVDDQIVIVPLPGSKCATTPRGSIALGTSRWFIIRCEMTTSASANAASIAVSSTVAVGAHAGAARHQRHRQVVREVRWMTVGLPVIASSRSTTAGSVS